MHIESGKRTPPLVSRSLRNVVPPGSAIPVWVYQEQPLETCKARVIFRHGVWYAVHRGADYPGVGATPEQAFANMLKHCPFQVRRDFLSVVSI
jgi:hypothetical protein